MSTFISLIILFIFLDLAAAIISALKLLKGSNYSTLIRAVGLLLGAFAVEQILQLIAVTHDYKGIKHSPVTIGFAMAGRLLRSLALWGLTLHLIGVLPNEIKAGTHEKSGDPI